MDEIPIEDNSLLYQQEVSQSKLQKMQSQACPLCSQPCLQILINNALYHKHQDAQNIYYIRYIDNIMDGQICQQAVKYREMNVQDQDQEFMRRMYNLQEYQYKNKAISQYYKFHKDYPKLHLNNIDRIMEKHYDRKKQYQYKKIKKVLKQEENISITTQKSSEIFSDIQDQQKKSHYSNILNDLTQCNQSNIIDDQNQSHIWKQMCKKIDKAYQNRKLSPLSYRPQSKYDANNNKESDVKKFTNYLKKQQQKKQKQQKYKNFIRSNKQSKYNSIQHDSKQYSSGTTSALNIIKNISKKQSQVNSRKTPFFYDGKMFFNGTGTKGSILSYKKQQKTKQQTNTPSHQNFDLQVHTMTNNAFKKNKQSQNNSLYNKNSRQIQRKGQQNDSNINNKNVIFNRKNSKNKLNQKTTQQIYKTATEQLKFKKRSISYNSLANANTVLSSKRNSIINTQPTIKDRDFQIRNRSSSKDGHKIKQKDHYLGSQIKSLINSRSNINLQRSKSTNNFKSHGSVPKFYNKDEFVDHKQRVTIQNGINTMSQNRKLLNQNPTISVHSGSKKIIIPKDLIKTIKGKSLSTSKLKSQHYRYDLNNNKDKDPTKPFFNKRQQMSHKNFKQTKSFNKNQNNILNNIWRQNHTISTSYDQKNIISNHNSTKDIDIDNLLKKKLNVSYKTNTNKIIII